MSRDPLTARTAGHPNRTPAMTAEPKPRPRRTRRRVFGFVAVALLAVLGWQGSYWSRYLHLASGYAAKVAASGVFVAGRDLDELRTHELKPFGILDVEVDRERHEVHVSAFGLFGQTARHRPGLGATLVHDDHELAGPSELALPDAIDRPLVERELDPLRRAKLAQAVDFAFRDLDPAHPWNTRAVIVLKDGEILAERYGDETGPDTPLHGWSMTKTVTGVLCGIAVADGLLSVEQKAEVAEWTDPERSEITIEHLLRMTSGLDFEESYSKPRSDALRMLFDSHDMAGFVATRPSHHAPGSRWHYSSGDSLLLSGIVRRAYGDEANFSLARDRLFAKVGMRSARLEFDGSGTAVGSSMCWATARDWARFGEFLRHGGRVGDEQIVPEGFIEWMATPTPQSADGSFGAHLWVNAGVPATERCAWPSLPRDLFWCAGFEGQFVVVAPSQNAVVVRLGQTFGEPEFPIESFLSAVLSALPE